MQILLIGEDRRTADRMRSALGRNGYDVLSVSTPRDAFDIFHAHRIEAVIVDRLPADGSALAAITQWRDAGIKTPVLILSARAAVTDRIAGLDAGADDYLAKPFDVAELDARLKALVRARDRNRQAEPDIIACGSIRLDRRQHIAQRAGKALRLQPREYRLLETLATRCGQIVPRSLLIEEVWNLRFDPRTKIIETQISRLRAKLSTAASRPAIETVRGVGYRLREDA